MRFVLSLVLSLMLVACSHEAENTGTENSSLTVLPTTYYAMSVPAAKAYTPSAAPRDVSRFERKVIVPGGPDGVMSPCAQNFDGIMDHLEGLMTPQIEENNRIAAMQAKVPGYRF